MSSQLILKPLSQRSNIPFTGTHPQPSLPVFHWRYNPGSPIRINEKIGLNKETKLRSSHGLSQKMHTILP